MSTIEGDMSELAGLCDALFDGTLTDEQKIRLSQMLDGSEPARQFYIRYLGLSASLFEYAGEREFSAPAANSPLGAPRPTRRWYPRPQLPDITPHQRMSKLWWPVVGVAAAAAIVIAIVLHGSGDRDAEADAEEFAAQITGLEDCTWADTKPAPELGDQLSHGRQLDLKSGIAEITFDSGAQVTLEGPATLDLNSAWEATLRRGKLRAEVPTEAVGFSILSATVDVVDLGKEFGMNVDASGAADVCVLEGAVEATPRNAGGVESTKFVLNEHNARRFSRTGSEEIKNAASVIGQFKKPTKLQRLAKSAKHVHWSFDESDGRTAQADGTWPTSGDLGALIETSNSAQQTEPRVAGRWHGALRFDGHLHAHATVPGFSTRGPHTVAFWVRILPDTQVGDSGPMVAWLTKAQDATHVQPVQIGWNTNPAQGPVGALRTDLGRIAAIGTTNLRDGQWHHLAIVIVPRNTGKQRWHIRQYVDGHLEAATEKNFRKPHADTIDEPADDIVWLGREVGKPYNDAKTFLGELDELFIADRALPPQQISQLFRENEMTSLETAKPK